MLEMQRNGYVLRRWWWLLVLSALLGGVIAYGATKILVGARYQSTAMVAVAPPPQLPTGLAVTSFSASADAQLMATLSTAEAAVQHLNPADRASVNADQLAHHVSATSSIDGQLLFVSVLWPTQRLSPILANAVAESFIHQERARLASRYAIVHASMLDEQKSLATLIRGGAAGSQSQDWLHNWYAETGVRLSENDADARIAARTQSEALQLAQAATAIDTIKAGPKATTNALLGAGLGLLIALLFAYITTNDYPQPSSAEGLRPVLSQKAE